MKLILFEKKVFFYYKRFNIKVKKGGGFKKLIREY